MHRLPVNSLTHWLHQLVHSLRMKHSPRYRALALAVDREYRDELWANDTAALYRSLGHDMPVGTILAGVRVTR